MLKLTTTKKFEKEVERAKKRGKNIAKLNEIIELLLRQEKLSVKHKNHKLKGNLLGYWECHIDPDWLFMYQKTETHIICVSTGTHSDLF